MKLHLSNTSLIFLLTMYLSVAAYAQPLRVNNEKKKLSYGLKAGYAIQYFNFNDFTVNRTMRIESEESAYREANRLGVFSRLDYKRFSLQAEIGFSQLTGGSGPLLSADNSLDTSRLGKWSIGRSTELEGTWELGLQGGLRVFKWFRVFAGANVWHTRKSKIIPEIFEENNPLDDDFRRAQAYHQNSRSMVSIAERESILPFVLTRQVGAGLDFKHFSVEAMHELSITPLSRTFNYRGETYPFRRSTSRLTVSLAYRFYRFTFRKKPQIYN